MTIADQTQPTLFDWDEAAWPARDHDQLEAPQQMLVSLQEWCEDCAPEDEPFDEQASPGMPREVVDSTVDRPGLLPEEWDADNWGPSPEYEIVRLSCGHEQARLLR
jgi:hypothetical protein